MSRKHGNNSYDLEVWSRILEHKRCKLKGFDNDIVIDIISSVSAADDAGGGWKFPQHIEQPFAKIEWLLNEQFQRTTDVKLEPSKRRASYNCLKKLLSKINDPTTTTAAVPIDLHPTNNNINDGGKEGGLLTSTKNTNDRSTTNNKDAGVDKGRTTTPTSKSSLTQSLNQANANANVVQDRNPTNKNQKQTGLDIAIDSKSSTAKQTPVLNSNSNALSNTATINTIKNTTTGSRARIISSKTCQIRTASMTSQESNNTRMNSSNDNDTSNSSLEKRQSQSPNKSAANIATTQISSNNQSKTNKIQGLDLARILSQATVLFQKKSQSSSEYGDQFNWIIIENLEKINGGNKYPEPTRRLIFEHLHLSRLHSSTPKDEQRHQQSQQREQIIAKNSNVTTVPSSSISTNKINLQLNNEIDSILYKLIATVERKKTTMEEIWKYIEKSTSEQLSEDTKVKIKKKWLILLSQSSHSKNPAKMNNNSTHANNSNQQVFTTADAISSSQGAPIFSEAKQNSILSKKVTTVVNSARKQIFDPPTSCSSNGPPITASQSLENLPRTIDPSHTIDYSKDFRPPTSQNMNDILLPTSQNLSVSKNKSKNKENQSASKMDMESAKKVPKFNFNDNLKSFRKNDKNAVVKHQTLSFPKEVKQTYSGAVEGRPAQKALFKSKILPDDKMAEVYKRFNTYDPFWKFVKVVAIGQTILVEKINGRAIKAMIKENFERGKKENVIKMVENCSFTLSENERNLVKDWGVAKSTKSYEEGQTRLIFRTLPSTYSIKKRADCHLWPKGTFLYLNKNKALSLTQRKQQGHDFKLWKGMCEPLDLTSILTEPNRTNTLQIGTYDEETHYFCLAVCTFRSVATVYQSLSSFNFSILENYSREQSIQKALKFASQKSTMVDDDDEPAVDEEVGKFVFTLTCPISKKVMATPVRGKSCLHWQCFDLNNFLASNLTVSGGRWRCASCENFLSFKELQVCGLTMDLIKEFDGQASSIRDRVEFCSDRSYKLLQNTKRRYQKQRHGGGNNDSNQSYKKRRTGTGQSAEPIEIN